MLSPGCRKSQHPIEPLEVGFVKERHELMVSALLQVEIEHAGIEGSNYKILKRRYWQGSE